MQFQTLVCKLDTPSGKFYTISLKIGNIIIFCGGIFETAEHVARLLTLGCAPTVTIFYRGIPLDECNRMCLFPTSGDDSTILYDYVTLLKIALRDIS
jgi:hypothetical protein